MTIAPGRSPTRTTSQRSAVVNALSELSDFRSAQEIHVILHERGDNVGLATVYRSLALMLDSGDVDVLMHDDGEALYRRCSPRHHHHLVCRSCNRTAELLGPAVGQWASAVAAEHGFSDVSHTLEVFGLCSRCSSQDAG